MKGAAINLAGMSQNLVAVKRLLYRHHVIIAAVLVLGFLIYAVNSVRLILNQPFDQAAAQNVPAQERINIRFDQATIQKIYQLKSRQNPSLTLPDGKRNPFQP